MGAVSLLLAALCSPLVASPQESLGELQPRIHGALDRAEDWLLDRQLLDGSWGGWQESYRGGVSALALYTLLKGGLEPGHPAIVRGFRYLQTQPPEHTYSLGALLLALGAADDERYEDWMEELTEEMLDWMPPNGLYGYPGKTPDLSNTLFAALGLHAVQSAGGKVPKKAWKQLVEATLRCEAPREKVPGAEGTGYEAGFSYTPGGGASGSMCSAGITILALAELHLGRLGGDMGRQAKRATEESIRWLGNHWSFANNPPARVWKFYHLYGLERVGDLLEIEHIGAHDWYLEGAKWLVDNQTSAGTWHEGMISGVGAQERVDHEELNTCMGILFLRRATSIALTGDGAGVRRRVYETAEQDAPASLRATGDTPMTMWVVRSSSPGTSAEFFARHRSEAPEARRSLGRAEERGGRMSLQHRFPRSGEWWLSCVVESEAGPLESPELLVRVDAVAEPHLLRYADDSARNLLDGVRVEAAASSSAHANRGPGRVVNGVIGRPWRWAADDEEPSVTLRCERPVKARRILFTHPDTRVSEGGRPRPRQLLVLVGQKEFRVEMPADHRTKGELDLGKRTSVRTVEIHVLDLWDGVIGRDSSGFAEIEFQAG